MADDETLQRVKRDAQAALFRIPNVRAVALGHKYVTGKNTGELAIIVKVDRKLPPSAVPPGELIPPLIEGIKTDVVQWMPLIPLGALVNDQAKERPLLGGASIVIEYQDQDPNNPVMIITRHFGTLGFIGTTDGTTAGLPAGGIVGVTCQHVIANLSGATAAGHEVGQPTTDECSSCCFCCNDIIGKVLYGVKIGDATHFNRVDAALIALTKGLTYYADIKGGIGAVKGSRPLTTADVGSTVRKYGQTTGLTTGTVQTVSQAMKVGTGPAFADGQVTIVPVAGTPVWDCCMCTQGAPGCGGGNAENFPGFACTGDSGSAVVDGQGNVVGLLAWGGCDGTGTAIGIDMVMTALGVKVLTAAAAKTKQTVLGVAGINMAVGALRPAVTAVGVSSAQQEAFERARQELVSTPLGQRCEAIVREHHAEVLELINTNRRVAITWHRNGGSELIEGVLRMLQFHDQPLPNEIGGRPLAECLERLRRVFERYASPALAAAMNSLAPRVTALVGCTYPQLLATLQAEGGT